MINFGEKQYLFGRSDGFLFVRWNPSSHWSVSLFITCR